VPEKINWVGGLRVSVYEFLEIAGDREAYLGDFGLGRGWLKQKSSEGLVKGRISPPSRVEILGWVG
jgi:hypothetical protein